jgi:hypothetical protein
MLVAVEVIAPEPFQDDPGIIVQNAGIASSRVSNLLRDRMANSLHIGQAGLRQAAGRAPFDIWVTLRCRTEVR